MRSVGNYRKPRQIPAPDYSEEGGNDPKWELAREIQAALEEKRAIVSGRNIEDGPDGAKKITFHVALPIGHPLHEIYVEYEIRVVITGEAETSKIEIDDNIKNENFEQWEIRHGHDLLQQIADEAMSTYFMSLQSQR